MNKICNGCGAWPGEWHHLNITGLLGSVGFYREELYLQCNSVVWCGGINGSGLSADLVPIAIKVVMGAAFGQWSVVIISSGSWYSLWVSGRMYLRT